MKRNKHLLKYCALSGVLAIALLSLGLNPNELKPRRALFGQQAVDKILPEISPEHIVELHIVNARLSEKHWQIIGSFHGLLELTLRRVELDGNHLSYLKPISNLKRLILRVNGDGISDANIACLPDLHRLEEIALISENVTDEGISKLENASHLATVTLHCPKVSGSGLKYICRSGSLRHIELTRCRLDDIALKQIARVDYLQGLWLSNTGLGDESLTHIEQNLWLVNFVPSEKMTDAGLLKFREALIAGRQRARAAGLVVPPDDMLFINSQNKRVRGKPPAAGQSKQLDALLQSIEPPKP